MLPWSARSVVLTSLLGTLGAIPAYGGAYFVGLNSVEPGVTTYEAYGVSHDGSVVVGRGTKGQSGFGYLLKEGRFTDLGPAPDGGSLWPLDVSSDGSVVVGDRKHASGSEAFRWTADTGAIGLASSATNATAVSADGRVIVGWGTGGAFRWTEDAGLVVLPKSGRIGTLAMDVSANGSTIVGSAWSTSTSYEAVRWSDATGIVGLGDFAGGGFESDAVGVSGDGSVVVGFGTKPAGSEAFRWTKEADLVGLGDLPGGNLYSRATGISADGSIIVGISSTSAPVQEAFVWDEAHGMRSLSHFLSLEHSLDVDGWTFVTVRISGDGQTFVGQALNPEGGIEAYIAHVPEPASICLICAGVLGLGFRRPSASPDIMIRAALRLGWV